MSGALALIKATVPVDSAATVEADFNNADPATKAAMFLKAVRTQMKERVWPSAFLLYTAYTPGNTPPEFVARFNSDGGRDWAMKSVPERGEVTFFAIQDLMERLQAALPDDTGPGTMGKLRAF